ncbi:TNT domain-containing protein [Nocardioides lacusdianchii]|uniref:TNT domain-containing protein n=1 Tax=Nocardioides lacusdianchii TaxID=2783664 RepID=UPI001CCA92A6|nr:TNT domain-containing protein [Nocardioides lacusdianchii]
MPDFEVEGNPGNIRSRALLMEQKGQLFYDTGDALSKIDVSGWTGRAAEEFREAHDLEPDRWTKAGNGFKKAAAGLTTYAGVLEDGQRRAAEAKAEHERGQQESENARTQYGSYMDRMRAYWSSGGTDQAQPFVDWGDPIQQEALRAMQAVRADLDNAAHVCAGEVRAGCADAPEEPNWLESGLKFVGGIFEGAGEAVWDLLTMVPFSPVNLVIDAYKLATGDLTPEELAKTYELDVENAVDMAQGIYTGLTTDPIGFGKELGKSLLDWDTWADDPARAIGHLVPDAIAAVATGGAGALATRGAKGGMDVLDGLGDLNRLDNLDNLDDLGDLGDLRHVDLDDVTDWSRGRTLDDGVPGSENYPNGYDRYGGLGEQGFHDRYWDPEARDGGGGWRWPTEEHGFKDGFDGPPQPNSVEPGDVLDRYGPADGAYASPSGTPFDQRALPPSSVGSDYTQYEVLKPLPESVTEGRIAPWFEQPGGGVQYMFDKPMSWYVENGYLRKLD